MNTKNVRIRDLEDGLYNEISSSNEWHAGGTLEPTFPALLTKLNGRCVRIRGGSHSFVSLDDRVNIQDWED